MASLIPNLEPSHDSSPEFQRKKRRKTEGKSISSHRIQPNQTINRWRTQRHHQIYSSKLYEALLRSRRASTSASGKQVHQTADRILAISAKGTSRWSRAILTTPPGAAGAESRKHKKVKVTVNRRSRKPEVNRDKRKMPVVERKLKALGRLVPGCRKLSCANLLEETTDYIAALEMQVRAMKAKTDFLAGSGGQAPADRHGSNGNM